MIDLVEPIQKFISDNFEPTDLDTADKKLTSDQFLLLLFDTFPKDSIDDYELYIILTRLGYTPKKCKEDSSIKTLWAIKIK